MADATLLSWINAEVEHALTLVQDSIAKFSAAPENEAVLQPCPEHLHQVSGALRMVGLNGATLVCEAIEGSFAGINGQRPSAQTMGVIDRAVVALKDFVGELARGQADVPLRLYPVYRDLSGLLGKKTISEKDLFFPDVAVAAPLHAKGKAVAEEELSAFLQAQRARFQRGLLAWLRGGAAGLEEMRQTVDALHQVAMQLPEPRALWWAAGGLIDALAARAASDAEWLAAAKVVCNKHRFPDPRPRRRRREERRRAAARSAVHDRPARSIDAAPQGNQAPLPARQPVPARRSSRWSSSEFDVEWLEAALFDMHSRLDALKRVWEQYVAGEADKARVLPRARRRVQGQDQGPRQPAPDQAARRDLPGRGQAARSVSAPGPVLVIEMASAFLLVEHVIDHFTSPADDLDEQIVIMGGWLLDAAKGKSTGEPPAGLRPDLTEQHRRAAAARPGGARRCSPTCSTSSGVLDAFARDAGKRADARRAAALPAADAWRAFRAQIPGGGAGDCDLRGPGPGAGARRGHRRR